MAEPPEQGSQRAQGTDLDPEGGALEVDDDAFLVTGGRRWQFPTDLDVWLRWAGAVAVAVAAFQSLAFLITLTVSGWTIADHPLLPPDGYYSLLLLAAVLLLVLRHGSGSSAADSGWVRRAACLAAATGAALVVAQLVGNIASIVHPSNGAFGQPAAYTASDIVSDVGGLADAVIAGCAAVLALLLYQWSRAAASPAVEEAGEREPESGNEESGAPAVPAWRPRGPVGPALVSLLLGAVVALACLLAFDLGIRNQTNSETGLLPTSGSPAVSVPSPAGTATSFPLIIQCSTPAVGGSASCGVFFGTATPSPSS